MATASTARGARASAAKARDAEVTLPSRREFLYYIWGASMVLLTGELTAGFIWFIYPRFREGQFGGVFRFSENSAPAVSEFPAPNDPPLTVGAGRFHISNVEGEGLVVLFQVCTHLGCLPKWVPTNFRFECPCHGSKYRLDGHWIEGPAPRSLDRFYTELTFTDGTTAQMNAAGDPIPLEGRTIAAMVVDTGKRILRSGHV